MGKSGRSDPEIVGADDLTASCKLRPDLGVHARDDLGDRDRVEACKDVLNEGSPCRTDGPVCAVHSMQQLADGYAEALSARARPAYSSALGRFPACAW